MAATAPADLVPGDDGWISDESSFYGDEDTRMSWEDAASGPSAQTRLDTYCRLSSKLPANIAAERVHRGPADAAPSTANSDLYWPLEGQLTARQSNETPAQFVARIPPSTSNVPEHGDWLWIHNPRSPPLDPQFDQEAFVTAGTALLNEHLKKHGDVNANSKPRGGKQAMAIRDRLAKALRDLAVEFGCLAGKWMLFIPNDSDIDHVWGNVVAAVAADQLGPRAKISTASLTGSDRLICIYTKSFTNLGDVRKVLGALVNLKLVDPTAQSGIWYKSDAYTLLGISGKNPYGLRNSLYGSRDMLGQPAAASSSSSRRS